MKALIYAVWLLLLAGGVAWSDTPKGCLDALYVPGEAQIQYSDQLGGSHALYFDNRYFFPSDLPADAEIIVLRGDALFSCGGARINVLSGSIFTAGKSEGMEHIFLKEGELTVTIDAKTVLLDSKNRSFSFFPSAIRGPLVTPGFLR